jgi:hypothetical protein
MVLRDDVEIGAIPNLIGRMYLVILVVRSSPRHILRVGFLIIGLAYWVIVQSATHWKGVDKLPIQMSEGLRRGIQ